MPVCYTDYMHTTSRRERAIDRIDARLDRTGSCWLWPGGTREGYGKLSYRDHNSRVIDIGVHRAMYLRYVGPIPEGMQVHHKCGVKICANPDHLELLTPVDNLTVGRPCKDSSCSCACHLL